MGADPDSLSLRFPPETTSMGAKVNTKDRGPRRVRTEEGPIVLYDLHCPVFLTGTGSLCPDMGPLLEYRDLPSSMDVTHYGGGRKIPGLGTSGDLGPVGLAPRNRRSGVREGREVPREGRGH